MKILAGLLLLVIVYFISFWAMVKGWGIEPVDFALVMWSYVAIFVINLISVGLTHAPD